MSYSVAQSSFYPHLHFPSQTLLALKTLYKSAGLFVSGPSLVSCMSRIMCFTSLSNHIPRSSSQGSNSLSKSSQGLVTQPLDLKRDPSPPFSPFLPVSSRLLGSFLIFSKLLSCKSTLPESLSEAQGITTSTRLLVLGIMRGLEKLVFQDCFCLITQVKA